MNINKAIKYQILEMKKSVIGYYGIIYAIYILFAIFIGIYVSDGNNGSIGSIGGTEFSTAIFAFAIGLTSFKDTFKMFLQNGLSRRTLFKSFILSIMLLSIFMSLIDSVNTVIVNTISNYNPIYLQIYGRRYAEGVSEIVKLLDGFLWNTFIYLTVAMVGYFLAILYYRMDKRLTIIVSVGVPGLLFFVLPIIEFNFTKGAIIQTIGRFISFASGFENGYNPYYSIMTSIFVFIIFGGLSYGLMKKAVVKPT